MSFTGAVTGPPREVIAVDRDIPEAGFDLQEERRIAQWLDKVRFRRKLFGGVNEKDVWNRIGELNEMYRRALIAERARYDALLERRGEPGEVIQRE